MAHLDKLPVANHSFGTISTAEEQRASFLSAIKPLGALVGTTGRQTSYAVNETTFV